MIVSILGYNAGSFFAANEVDTPYTYVSDVPYYDGHPWNYYGPNIGVDFFFGNTGWWHGDGFAGNFTYQHGARAYTNAQVRGMYRGGTFQGRNYVARVKPAAITVAAQRALRGATAADTTNAPVPARVARAIRAGPRTSGPQAPLHARRR